MKRKKIGNISKNAGLTLVELIVTFALIGIFMVSATFVLSNSLRLFQRMESTSKAVTVSDLILDKISGEIIAADVDRKGKEEGYYFWMGDGADYPGSGSSWIVFGNRSKSPISIYEENGKLVIKYYGITKVDAADTKVKAVQEIDWKFDDNVYMGYRIQNLTFSRPQPEKHPNVVRIDLSLVHERTGFTYSTYRYAENYNYDGTSTRLGMRSDSDHKNEWPSEAEEFRYPADWEPTKPVEPTEPAEPVNRVEYTIYFKSINSKEEITNSIVRSGEENEKIIVAGSDKPVEGKTVVGPFPIKYYEYLPDKSKAECILNSIDKHFLELYYKPSDTDLVPITIQYINQETNEIIKTKNEAYKIESNIRLEPETLEGYECVSDAKDIVVSGEIMEPYIFEYKPVKKVEGSITVTDTEGNKHLLKAKNNWKDILEKAWSQDSGYDSNNKVDIIYDETGFYIAIENSLHVLHGTGDITLAEFAEGKKNIIKITEDTRLLLESDMTGPSYDIIWKPEVKPRRGELAYYKGEYYIAGGENEVLGERNVPPNGGSWIQLPDLKN